MNIAVRFPGKSIPREVVEALARSINLGIEICDQDKMRLYAFKQSLVSLEEGKRLADRLCLLLSESYELFPEFWIREDPDTKFIAVVDYAIHLEQLIRVRRRTGSYGPDMLYSHGKAVGP